jgi:hypothetical protein
LVNFSAKIWHWSRPYSTKLTLENTKYILIFYKIIIKDIIKRILYTGPTVWTGQNLETDGLWYITVIKNLAILIYDRKKRYPNPSHYNPWDKKFST